MKHIISSFLLLLAAPYVSGQTCTSTFVKTIMGPVSMTSDLVAFDVESGGTTTCVVTSTNCASFELTIAYNDNVNGGAQVAQVTDVANSGNCALTLSTTSTTVATQLGLQYLVVTTDDAIVTCTCTNPATPAPTTAGGTTPTAPTAPTPAPCTCFSATATVQEENKGQVAMEDLKVGDRVLTRNNQYQSVYNFGHSNKEQSVTFYQIYMDQQSTVPLEMTGNHLVYVEKGPGKATPVRADSVQVGDLLLANDGPVAVTKVSTTTKAGLYMPLTADGTLMVDGVLVSTYVSMQDEAPTVVDTASKHFFTTVSEQQMQHWWLSPYRMLCMGVSSNFSICREDSRDSEGILHWLATARRFIEWGEQHVSMMSILLIGVPLYVGFGLIYAVERLLGGPAMAPSMVLVLIISVAWMRGRQPQAGAKKTV